jgi:hypothetical protein
MSNFEEIQARSRELAEAEKTKARAKGKDLKARSVIMAMASAITDQLRIEFGPARYAKYYEEERARFLESASIEELRHMAELHRAAGEERNAFDAIFAADYKDWLAKQ